MKPLKVLLVASEAAPFAKVGGLGDVVGSLPKFLLQEGVDARVIIPLYRSVKLVEVLPEVTPPFVVPAKHHWEEAVLFAAKIPETEVVCYFIDNAKYFHRDVIYGSPDDEERFVFFSRAVLELLKRIDWQPDLFHLNDWQTALIPSWLNTIYKKEKISRIATLLTIHNLAYQGRTSRYILQFANLDNFERVVPEITQDLRDQFFDIMWEGISFADSLSTVSKTYAQEILTPEYGEGLEGLLQRRRARLFGIINGLDYDLWDPAKDKAIKFNYNKESLENKIKNKLVLQEELGLKQSAELPLIGIVSRLTSQKGFDLLIQALVELERASCQIVLLGTGEKNYQELFLGLAKKYPERFSVNLKFDDQLARRIYAGSDIFLMPSRFEPCGLGQLIAMRYGSIPIVRKTGGLADTVTNFDPSLGIGTGFVFGNYEWQELCQTIYKAIEVYKNPEVWRKIIKNAMSCDFSWSRSAKEYLRLYRETIAFKMKSGKGERKDGKRIS